MIIQFKKCTKRLKLKAERKMRPKQRNEEVFNVFYVKYGKCLVRSTVYVMRELKKICTGWIHMHTLNKVNEYLFYLYLYIFFSTITDKNMANFILTFFYICTFSLGVIGMRSSRSKPDTSHFFHKIMF